ncbi:MAG: hypothetical protein LJE64_00515 [Desulfofustis sp.]|jgi:hypothetical protein|nr:hypothetical protein [Desulfofustis sp.]
MTDFPLFDPTIATRPESIAYAPRPRKLEHLKLLLVENTKHNSKTILLKLFERLRDRYQMELLAVIRKQSAGHPLDESDIEAYRHVADAAIAGIGD